MIDKLNVQTNDPVRSHALSPYDGYDRRFKTFAFDPKKRANLNVERSKNGRPAETHILGNAYLAGSHISVLI